MTARTNPAAGAASIKVHQAKEADAPRLADLSCQLGYQTTPEEAARRFQQVAADPNHGLFVAESLEGRVIGWINVEERHLIETEPRAEINGLVVDEGHRSQGVGRALLQHAEHWARGRGFRLVVLRSNVIRGRAHAFYERQGYEVFKTQKVFRKPL
jgi:GNAT superfamily N-acetyltransferase